MLAGRFLLRQLIKACCACRESAHRGDSGHISFGGIVQSPSVASVAANIEAVGAPASLRAPDLLPRVSGLCQIMPLIVTGTSVLV